MPCSSSTMNVRGKATIDENTSVTASIPAAVLGSGGELKLASDIANTARRLNRKDVKRPWRDRISVSHSLWNTAIASRAQFEFVGGMFAVCCGIGGQNDCPARRLRADSVSDQALALFVQGGGRLVEQEDRGLVKSGQCKL